MHVYISRFLVAGGIECLKLSMEETSNSKIVPLYSFIIIISLEFWEIHTTSGYLEG